MSENKDFFISYNKADRQWAEWIAWHLEAENYTTVIQAWDFLSGSNFAIEMDKATKLAERTIAVLSPDYLTSRYTQSEWAAAFAQDPNGEKRSLIPVLVRPCQLSGLLAQIIYIKLTDLDEEAAKIALIGGVKLERRKPLNAPDFPGSGRPPQPEPPTFPKPVSTDIRSSSVFSRIERSRLLKALNGTSATFLEQMCLALRVQPALRPGSSAGAGAWATALFSWADNNNKFQELIETFKEITDQDP